MISIDRVKLGGVAVLAALSLVLLAGCRSIIMRDDDCRVRTAVYVDEGARNTGAFRLLQFGAFSPELDVFPVDAAMIRDGALARADVLVMPGGSSNLEAATLGEEGRRKVRDFIRSGGGYLGICAGCFLALEPSPTHPDMLHVMPYASAAPTGLATLAVRLNSRAEQLFGVRAGVHDIRFADGPVMKPSLPVKGAEFEILATYDSDVNPCGDPPRESLAGQAAIVAGTYGKGRVVGCAVHPEYMYSSDPIVRGAFRFLTGRDVTWQLPQRRCGQLAVGIWTPRSFGVANANRLLELMRSREFDLVPINVESVNSYAHDHLDALVAPPDVDVGFFSGPVCTDLATAAAELRRLAARPPSARPPDIRVPSGRRIRACVFADPGGGDYHICSRLARTPAFDVRVVSGQDIAEGALRDCDLLVMPGGSCRQECRAMGEKGCDELVNFIREGGSYYGVCAGAFLASQLIREDYPRLGFVPFKDEDEPVYRGGCPARMKLTEDGKAVFKSSAEHRTVFYNGGPVFVPGEALPDTDVRVLMTYDCENISTRKPDPVMSMRGKGAFLAGTVGRGRVFVSAPHPEGYLDADDLVDDAIEYLTGVRPDPYPLTRAPGALVVRFRYKQDSDAVNFYLHRLLPERSFDVRVGTSGYGLKHADVCIVTAIKEGDFGPDLEEFARLGGTVIALADSDERRQLLAKLPWVTPVATYDEIFDLLSKLKPQTNS